MSVAVPPDVATGATTGGAPPEDTGRRRRVPWRVAARLARRDVRRSPGRTAVVAGIVALPLAVVTLWLVAYATQLQPAPASDRLEEGVEAYLYTRGQPILQAGPRALDLVEVGEPAADEGTWADVAAQLGVLLPGVQGFATTGCESTYLPATAAWTSTCTYVALGEGPGPVEGRAPTSAGEVLVPAGSGPQVGAELETVVGGATRTLEVVGAFDPGLRQDRSLRVGTDDAAIPFDGEVWVTGPAVTWDDVVRLNEVGIMAIARTAIEERPDESRIPFFVQGYTIDAGGSGLGEADVAMIALGVAAVLLLLVLVVAPSHVVGVRRSARTYALLAATGADGPTLRAVVLLGAVLQGLVTAGVGIGLGIGVSYTLAAVAPNMLADANVPVVVPWLALAGLAAVAVATVVAAALVPARTAARTDAVRVLAGRRGEAAGNRRTPVLGAVLAAAGFVGGVGAALSTEPALVVVALVAVVIGLLLCAGALVELVARLFAGRASLPVRLALRDSVRHRSRSVAAVTAVTAAAATLVGASLVIASDSAHNAAIIVHGAGDGAVIAYPYPDAARPAAVLESVTAAVHQSDPAASAVTVRVPGSRLPGVPDPVALTWGWDMIEAAPAPEKQCPADVEGAQVDEGERARLERDDPRCAPEPMESYGTPWDANVFVDDGTWVAGTGLPGAAEAAAQVAEGKVLVADDLLLHADGTVRLTYTRLDPQSEDVVSEEIRTFPGVLAPGFARSAFTVVLPVDVATSLGLESVPGAVIALPGDDGTRDAVTAAMRTAGAGSAWTSVEDHDASANPVLTTVLSVSALVLGIGTAGLVLLLVAGETRADLAVLSAVGASPRTRRRLAAGQSGVLVGIGTLLGAVIGVAVAVGFVALSARRGGFVDPTWSLAVPWLRVALIVVLLPVGAWVTGWLTTRSRLPMPSDVR